MDAARWTMTGRHVLGRSEIDPANIEVKDGQLQLKLPAGVLSGAELRTAAKVAPGVFEARMRLADAPTSITGLFMYSPPDYAHEIDIELYNRPAGRVRFTTYSGGALTHTIEQPLPFDPTAEFHLYGIAQTSTGIEFYVDQKLLQAWDGGTPREPMNLYLNAWYPQWLAGSIPSEAQATAVDSVSYRPS